MASLICGRPPEAPRNQGYMPGEENVSNASSGEPKHLVVIKPKRRLRKSKGLTPSAWRKAFDLAGRPTNIAKLLGKVQRGGIHPSIRPEVWELLLGVWSVESTAAERTALRNRHRDLYAETLELCREIHPGLGTGKLAYAVNDSRVLDARSSFWTPADRSSAPNSNGVTNNDKTVPDRDETKGTGEYGEPPPPSPGTEQLGWGAKFLFDIAKRGLSPEGKEGQLRNEVSLEYYVEVTPSEGEALNQGLRGNVQTSGRPDAGTQVFGADALTQGLETKTVTQDGGPGAEAQGSGTETQTQGLTTGATSGTSVTGGEFEGLGTLTQGLDAEGPTRNLGTVARLNGLVTEGKTRELESSFLTPGLGAGAGTNHPGAAVEKWDMGAVGHKAGLLNRGEAEREEYPAGGGSVLEEAAENDSDLYWVIEEPKPDAGFELTPGLSANIGPSGTLTKGHLEGLPNPNFRSTVQANPGTGSEKAVGGVPEENSRETPVVTLCVTRKLSPEAGPLEKTPELSEPLTTKTVTKSTCSLTPEETANPVFEKLSEPALEVGRETATVGSESRLGGKPPPNPAVLGRVKTLVAEIERRTLEEEEANRQGLARKPSGVGGVKRGLGTAAAETESELIPGGDSGAKESLVGLTQNDKVVEPLMAARKGAFTLEGGQLEQGEPVECSAAELIGIGQAGTVPAGKEISVQGADSVRGAESAGGADSVQGADSAGGADSVQGADSAGGADSLQGADSVRGADSVQGAEVVGGAQFPREVEYPLSLTLPKPRVLTSATKQNVVLDTKGVADGPGPLSRSRSASVIPTTRVTPNLEANPDFDDHSAYATPDSRFTAFSTPNAGFFTPDDRSLSAFSAYATPEEGFFTPERRGRSASASPGLSGVSERYIAKPSDWDARKGGAAGVGGLSVNTGAGVEQKVGVNVGPGENTEVGENGGTANGLEAGTEAGVNPGGVPGKTAGVNRGESPGTREARDAELPVTLGLERGVVETSGGDKTLDEITGGNDLKLGSGEFAGVLEPVVVRESRSLRCEPNAHETLRLSAADVSNATNADVSAGVTAAVSAGDDADVRTGILADVSTSEDAEKGVGKGPTNLLLVVETGSHLTALGQGPIHTTSSRAVTLGRVSVTPGRLNVEWTDRGSQTPGETAPLVMAQKKRALYSSNAEETLSPGPVKPEAGHFSVGIPAGVRLTGPEAERAGEWLWTLHRIVVDVVRTDRHLAFYDVTANLARMTNILAVYAWRDPEVGYCQGMSDLLSPFVVLFQNDADAFWCFERLMARVRHNFCARGPVGVLRQLDRLREIVDVTDPTVGKHLRAADADNFLFAFRMLLVIFRRELSFSQALMLWEMTWAADFERNGDRNRISAESGLNAGGSRSPGDSEQNAGRNGFPAESKRSRGRNGLPAASKRSGARNGSITGSPADHRNGARNGTGITAGFIFNETKGAGGLDEGPEKGEDNGAEGADCADDLFVYYVAVILHHNCARLKSEVREMDDALKVFNAMELRIDVRRCVESAVKRRKAFLRKMRAKGKT